MPKIILLLALLVFPASALCWSQNGHRLLTKLALEPVADQRGLNEKWRAAPLKNFVVKLKADMLRSDPRLANDAKSEAAWLSEILKINPAVDIAEQKSGGAIFASAIEILSYHSADPDDGRDQDLDLHSYQKIFGGTRGPSSQAFRHMEKPALSPFNFRSTLGLPLKKAGEASERAQIYFDLSRLAKAYDEDYWSWRFLACALHYLEDLAVPHHATEISSHGKLFGRGLKIYVAGRTGRKFSDIVARLVTNSHDWFETFAEAQLRNGPFAPRHAKEPTLGSPENSVAKLAVTLRNESNRIAPDLLAAIFFVADDRIAGLYRYDQDAWPRSDPSRFLRSPRTKKIRKHRARLEKIMSDCFARGAVIVREVLERQSQPVTEVERKILVEKLLRAYFKISAHPTNWSAGVSPAYAKRARCPRSIVRMHNFETGFNQLALATAERFCRNIQFRSSPCARRTSVAAYSLSAVFLLL